MRNDLRRPFADPLLKRKFFYRNLVSMLIPCLIPLLVLSSLAIYISNSYIRLDEERNQEQMLSQYNELIKLIVSEVDSLNVSFDMDPKIKTRLGTILSKNTYSDEDLESIFYLKNMIDVPANSKPYIRSVYVYYENEKGRFLSSREGIVELNNYFDTSWYSTYRWSSMTNEIRSEIREIREFPFNKSPEKVISLYKILSNKGTGRIHGVIVVNVLPSYLEKSYESLNERTNRALFITDKQGGMIAQSGSTVSRNLLSNLNLPDSFDLIRFERELQQITVKQTDRLHWNLISIVPKNSLFNLSAALVAMTGWLSLATLAICACLALWLTRKNYRQVYGIIHILESADSPDPIEPPPQKADDIYALIIKNIVETFIEQKYLKVQLSERLYKVQALEFRALQSQINPHFLYNTLNSIYWKTIQLTNAPNTASRMIELLSEILQYALDTSPQTVKLYEEIANIRSYVGIQQMRYKDRFEMVWDKSQQFDLCEVLKLSIQPFIENSIQYGTEAKSYLQIKVKYRLQGSVLKVTIIDNGLGMDSDRLAYVRAALSNDSELAGHVGISNTNKRFVLQYGEDFRIRLLSKKGWGTAVTLHYPQQKMAKELKPIHHFLD